MEERKTHKINIIETVFRDAQQSLIATRMRTEDMIPIIEKMDNLGYWSFEMWGGATFDAMIRFLDEDPWERVRIFKKYAKKTKLQMLLRGKNLVGYRHYPDDIIEKFIKKSRELGIEVFRIFDALNDIRNLEKPITFAKKEGTIVQGAISYTKSPVHTIDSYINFAKELKNLGCDIITIKDMAGLITPKVTFELIKRLKEEINLPINLHSHCTTGFALVSYYKAIEANVDYLDTAISPFSLGTSQPPTELILKLIEDYGHKVDVKLSELEEITSYFENLKEKYLKYLNPISQRVDINALIYQIPGGMMSNLISQLESMKALDKFKEVLKEIPKVREELGYIPLVTPTSQIVGTQATLNVISGERYKLVTQEVKDLVKGLYGKTPAPIKSEIVKKILGDEKEEKSINHNSIWEKAKEEVKIYSEKEEDILTFALFPNLSKDFFEKKFKNKKKELNELKSESFDKKVKNYKISIEGREYKVKIEEI
ncbi:MAG: pyruvate carboxylase subunit B [Caldisericia bacterium]